MKTLRRVIFISVGATFTGLGMASTVYWHEPIWGAPAFVVGVFATILGIKGGAS